MNSIIDYLQHWVAAQPDRHFCSFLDVYGNVTDTYTYLGFQDRTQYVAEYLSYLGMRRHDRALLIYPPGLEIIVAFFACARIGVIPVPVYAPTTLNLEGGLMKLDLVARDCQATVALTSAAYYQSFQVLMAQRRPSSLSHNTPSLLKLEWVTTDSVRGRPSNDFRDDSGSILFLQYTSGSTSDPKGVIVSHENVIHNAHSTIDHVPTGVSWLPQYHDMGLIGYYLHPLVMGGMNYGFSPIDFLRRPFLWLLTINRVRATYASSPNFGFEYCLREDKIPPEQIADLDLSSLRVLMNASEPVCVDTYRRFLERFKPYGLRPQAHVVAYGLAENTLAATHYGKRILSVNRRTLQQSKLEIEDEQPLNNNQLQIASCGKALDGIQVRVVNPRSHAAQPEKQIGEIWITGKSLCQGYWKRPKLTREVFRNKITNDSGTHNVYLRTGDLGFLHENELFVCGRIKDLIIIRGVNYYPQDIEVIVESASPKIRTGGVVAFSGAEAEETLVVVLEVRTRKDLPDPIEIARAIRRHYSIEPYAIVFAVSRTIVRTTSGKISRSLTRQRWLDGVLPTIATYFPQKDKRLADLSELQARFLYLLDPYNLTGQEEYTLAEIGLDSLTLVTLVADIEELLQQHDIATDLDVRLLQRMTVAEFFSLLEKFETESDEAILTLRHALSELRQEQDRHEMDRMRFDAELKLRSHVDVLAKDEPLTNILLTGATGFFGPFLLSSLLTQTTYTYYVLTRAGNPGEGLDRIRSSLRRAQLWTPDHVEQLQKRVRVVCGDISQHNLGLHSEQWEALTKCVHAVVHNAALVNYVLNYEGVKSHNVYGTRELLRFSYTGIQKEFHFISSTTIFGWTVKETLYETDNNTYMENLDFGYAQSKWVAEQIVFAAEKQGLKVRVYRPSFITASAGGVSSREDIVIRLLAFMINHGIAVNARNQISFLPADIAAHNIVNIFKQQQTTATTFHVTVDDYYNLMDVTRLITSDYGYTFEYYDIPDFVVEMRRSCGKDELLYPLRDFFNRSYQKMIAMQHKRYNNDRYREARGLSDHLREEPTLKDTVSYLMTYMLREGIIKRDGHKGGDTSSGQEPYTAQRCAT